MAIKGNLADFSLPQLLDLINRARKTGALHLLSPIGPAADLYFREGKLIAGLLGDHVPELATLLRKLGKITVEQRQEALARATMRTDKELGLILINAGYVNQAAIVQAVRNQLLETIYQLFTWQEGAFSFEQDARPPEDRITVSVHLEGVTMEGTRRAQELKMLEAELPNLEWTLKFAERPRANPRRINLSMDEWHVSSSINPRNSIRHIAEANNLSEFQIRKIVHRLLAMGWVQLVQPERLRSAAAAAPLPAPPPGRARLPQSGA